MQMSLYPATVMCAAKDIWTNRENSYKSGLVSFGVRRSRV